MLTLDEHPALRYYMTQGNGVFAMFNEGPWPESPWSAPRKPSPASRGSALQRLDRLIAEGEKLSDLSRVTLTGELDDLRNRARYCLGDLAAEVRDAFRPAVQNVLREVSGLEFKLAGDRSLPKPESERRCYRNLARLTRILKDVRTGLEAGEPCVATPGRAPESRRAAGARPGRRQAGLQDAESFTEAARGILEKRGPMEIFALVAAAQKVRPLRKPLGLIGQKIFRLARDGEGGLRVVEYPSFQVKASAGRIGGQGRLPAAYKVLVRFRQGLDLRAVSEQTVATGALRTMSDCPEYWLYEALRSTPEVFARKGSLKIGIGRPDQRRRGRSEPSVLLPATSRSALAEALSERDLEDSLAKNPGQIEPGLRVVGRQHNAPGAGRIDLLCEDRKRSLVVVEIKKPGANIDAVIAQILGYVGWVKRHMAAPRQRVRGIIICGRPDERLRYQAIAVRNVSIKCINLGLEDFDPDSDLPRVKAAKRSR